MKPKQTRQDNPIAAAPPPIVDYVISARKVQKGGAISIGPSFRQGTRVNLLQIDEQTILVSGRPPKDLQVLAQSIPSPTVSPYAALSSKIRGTPHAAGEVRIRARAQDLAFSLPDDAIVLQNAQLQRPSRKR